MRVQASAVDATGSPFRLETLELDEPGPGEALVRVVATGLCHTDAITRDGDLLKPVIRMPQASNL
jgi:aryl-alcohol dehydrogenase